MMDWTARLAQRREKNQERPSCTVPKVPKAPFVTSDTKQDRRSEKTPTPSVTFDTPQTDLSDNIRNRLLTLTEAEGMDAGLVHELVEADMADLTGLPDSALLAFLHARQDTTDRMAGRIPARETAAMLCIHCGPVWASPAVTAVLPVVDSWPRALGCPWCHVRKALKAIPRPPITCATCQHYRPDMLNPEAGTGECMAGHGFHYPMQRHRCGQYHPKENQP